MTTLIAIFLFVIGDVSGNHGHYDMWVVKLSTDININNSGEYIKALDINDIVIDGKTIKINNAIVKFENGNLSKITEINLDTEITSTTMNNGLYIQTGSNSGEGVYITVDNLSLESLGYINGFPSVTPSDNAQTSIAIIDSAIQKVSTNRSRLGSTQNRFEHILSNICNYESNITAAEARIRDSDMAKEMIEMVKNNILTQASQAMLSQANNLPENILLLLR